MAKVFSLYGIMTVYPESLWNCLHDAGCRQKDNGGTFAMPPLATQQVISVWKSWLPKLVALASAVFVDKQTKLAMSCMPMRVNKASGVSMVRLGPSFAPPEVDASSCMALLDPLAIGSYGDFKSLSDRSGCHKELMVLCDAVDERQWARKQRELSDREMSATP